MKRAIKWASMNIPFSALVVAGTIYNIGWAENVAAFLTVFFGICGLIIVIVPLKTLAKETKEPKAYSNSHRLLDSLYDLIIGCIWASSGHFVLAGWVVLIMFGTQINMRVNNDVLKEHESCN